MSQHQGGSSDTTDALARYSETQRQQSERSEIIEAGPRVLERAAIYIGTLAVVSLGILLTIGQIDIVVSTRGQVLPEREYITVQSRNAGVLAEVPVRVGDSVEAGQQIARLAGGEAKAALEALERSLMLRRAEQERRIRDEASLAALVADFDRLTDPELDLSSFGAAVDEVQAARVAMQEVARQRRRAGPELEALRNQTAARIGAIQDTIGIRLGALELARNELGSIDESNELRTEQLRGIEVLIERGLATRERMLQIRDEMLRAASVFNLQREKISNLELAVASDRLEVSQRELDLQAEIHQRADALAESERALSGAKAAIVARLVSQRAELEGVKAEVARIEADLALRREQAAALDIRAPAPGVIASLPFPSAGMQLVDGAEVARIVPEGARTILQATLASRDAGRVKPGQTAVVKLDAFPFYRYGTLPARVDAVFPQPGARNFTVRLELLENDILVGGRKEEIAIGLDATVDIVTERRRLLSILFDRGREALLPSAAPVDQNADGAGDGAG